MKKITFKFHTNSPENFNETAKFLEECNLEIRIRNEAIDPYLKLLSKQQPIPSVLKEYNVRSIAINATLLELMRLRKNIEEYNFSETQDTDKKIIDELYRSFCDKAETFNEKIAALTLYEGQLKKMYDDEISKHVQQIVSIPTGEDSHIMANATPIENLPANIIEMKKRIDNLMEMVSAIEPARMELNKVLNDVLDQENQYHSIFKNYYQYISRVRQEANETRIDFNLAQKEYLKSKDLNAFKKEIEKIEKKLAEKATDKKLLSIGRAMPYVGEGLKIASQMPKRDGNFFKRNRDAIELGVVIALGILGVVGISIATAGIGTAVLGVISAGGLIASSVGIFGLGGAVAAITKRVQVVINTRKFKKRMELLLPPYGENMDESMKLQGDNRLKEAEELRTKIYDKTINKKINVKADAVKKRIDSLHTELTVAAAKSQAGIVVTKIEELDVALNVLRKMAKKLDAKQSSVSRIISNMQSRFKVARVKKQMQVENLAKQQAEKIRNNIRSLLFKEVPKNKVYGKAKNRNNSLTTKNNIVLDGIVEYGDKITAILEEKKSQGILIPNELIIDNNRITSDVNRHIEKLHKLIVDDTSFPNNTVEFDSYLNEITETHRLLQQDLESLKSLTTELAKTNQLLEQDQLANTLGKALKSTEEEDEEEIYNTTLNRFTKNLDKQYEKAIKTAILDLEEVSNYSDQFDMIFDASETGYRDTLPEELLKDENSVEKDNSLESKVENTTDKINLLIAELKELKIAYTKALDAKDFSKMVDTIPLIETKSKEIAKEKEIYKSHYQNILANMIVRIRTDMVKERTSLNNALTQTYNVNKQMGYFSKEKKIVRSKLMMIESMRDGYYRDIEKLESEFSIAKSKPNVNESYGVLAKFINTMKQLSELKLILGEYKTLEQQKMIGEAFISQNAMTKKQPYQQKILRNVLLFVPKAGLNQVVKVASTIVNGMKNIKEYFRQRKLKRAELKGVKSATQSPANDAEYSFSQDQNKIVRRN